MTEEKALYLVKKLEKNIKKEIFSIFDYMFFDCEDDRNYEYEVAYDLNHDEESEKYDPYFYVYYGDYRKSDKYKLGDEIIRISCYFKAVGRDDDLFDSSRITAYTLARLIHFSKKYDKKIKKQEMSNEPNTN